MLSAFTCNCVNCGRPFEPPPSAPHKRFCSAKCRDQWNYQNVTRPKRLAAAEARRSYHRSHNEEIPDHADR